MGLIIRNIKSIVQWSETIPNFRKGKEMMFLPVMENAWLAISNGKIEDFGPMSDKQKLSSFHNYESIDASGSFVFPSWIDAHTHLVFPESREHEFEMKIAGYTYEQIAAQGGGILNSAKRLEAISEDELFHISFNRLIGLIMLGTGAVEIKSGYGLNTGSELKILRVIKRLKHLNIVPIKATFLGAHAIPAAFKHDRQAYIRLIINEMLPEVASGQLADYVDIFIEKGFFSPDDARLILTEAIKFNLIPRLHVDQLSESGGLDVAVEFGAISADHLEQTGDNGIEKLKKSNTIPVLLPSCAFFLKMKYPDARKMIDRGLGVVIASDFNPGSSPSGNMNFCFSLACIQMNMFPAEVVNAMTLNAAYALDLQHELGTIRKGAVANLFITSPIPSLAYLPYFFGRNQIDKIIVNGKLFKAEDYKLT